VGFFQARELRAGDLGKEPARDVTNALSVYPLPLPKVGLGCRPLKGSEQKDFLKQANLNSFATGFYAGEQGLNLVIKEKQSVCSQYQRRNRAGDRLATSNGSISTETKLLANRLRTISWLGYGWQQEVIQLVLAVLFRAGSNVVTYHGRPYRSYQDPGRRQPFATNNAFRAASFAPRESIDLKTLTIAVQTVEEIGRSGSGC